MSAPKEAVEAVQSALLAEGAGPGNSIHSWRCEHPDRYGPCDCVAEVARAAADAAAPHIAAQALRWASSFTTTPDVTFRDLADARDWLREQADRIEAGQ